MKLHRERGFVENADLMDEVRGGEVAKEYVERERGLARSLTAVENGL